ncbi:MAG: hypothetical protein PHW65_00165 [Dehalococcoidales bacterium]|nr:hypothetical protein [Dehalococcoidales bacterium]
MNFEQARDAETAWKSRELLDAACRLVQAGLDQLARGCPYFGPDDIPESFTAGGQGITGSATHILRASGIIADYYGHHPDEGIVHGRRRSKRASANGRKVALYSIVGRGLADAFLARNGAAREPIQKELAI